MSEELFDVYDNVRMNMSIGIRFVRKWRKIRNMAKLRKSVENWSRCEEASSSQKEKKCRSIRLYRQQLGARTTHCVDNHGSRPSRTTVFVDVMSCLTKVWVFENLIFGAPFWMSGALPEYRSPGLLTKVRFI